MDSERIQELLDKYWEGVTTIQEEVELKTLLSRSTDSRFEKEVELFGYYAEQSKTTAKSAPDFHTFTAAKRGKKGRTVVWNAMKVAAVIIVLFVAGWLVREEIREDTSTGEPIADTFKDPKVAFEETKKALMLISQNIGKGKSHASKVKAFSEAEEKVKTSATKKNKDENI